MRLRAGILTVSDRSSMGLRPDATGPRLRGLLEARGWEASATSLVPDEIPAIQGALKEWCDLRRCDVALVAGGTGLAPRDVTPEAVRPLLDRELPGFGELMREAGRRRTPLAALSRGLAGSRGQCLILALPGSPDGAEQSLEAVMDLLPHAISLLRGHNPHPEEVHAHRG